MSTNTSATKIDKALGKRIMQLRIERGYTRTAFAPKIGVAHQQLEKYEKGMNRISAGRLLAIAKTLNVTAGSLIDDVEKFVPSFNEGEKLGFELARIFAGIKDKKICYALIEWAKTLH